MPPETTLPCPNKCGNNLLYLRNLTYACPKCDKNALKLFNEANTRKEITKDSLKQQLAQSLSSAPERIQMSVLNAAQGTPLTIEYEDLPHYFTDLDVEVKQYMNDFPERFRVDINDAMTEYTKSLPLDNPKEITVNITQPAEMATKINEIGRDQIDKLLTVKGMLSTKGERAPILYGLKYYCPCDPKEPYATIKIKPKDRTIRTMIRCPKCGKDIMPESRIFHETMTLAIEQDSQETKNQEANKIYVQLKNGLTHHTITDNLSIGKQIIATGTLDVLDENKKTTYYLRALGIKVLEEKEEEPTKEDEATLLALREKYGDLVEYFSTTALYTTIIGFDDGKIALTISAIGTYPHRNQNKMVRPTIPTYFVGAPSTGKSQCLKLFAIYLPGNIFVDAASASGAGLFAGVEKDPFTDQNILKPGALVRTKNHLLIDEFNCLSEEALDEILSPMENLEVVRTKIASGRYVAQKTINAASNPVGGFFDNMKPKHHQIGVKPAILSRFDIILLQDDMVDEKKDAAIHRKLLQDYKEPDPDNLPPQEPVALFRKYIKLAKTFKPTIPDELDDYTTQFYLKLRMQKAEDHNVTIAPRQSESINRIAIAHARGNLRHVLTKEDYDWAFNYFSRTRGVTAEGNIRDYMVYDVLSTGQERQLEHQLIDILPKWIPGDENSSLTSEEIFFKLGITEKSKDIKLIEETLESTKKKDSLGIVSLRGRRYAKQ